MKAIYCCPPVRNGKTKAMRKETTCSETYIRLRAELAVDLRPLAHAHIRALALDLALQHAGQCM